MMMIVIINYVHDLNVILTGNLEKNMSPEMCMIANCKMVLIFNVCPVQKSVFPCAYWPDSKSVTNYSAMFPRTPFYIRPWQYLVVKQRKTKDIGKICHIL